VGEIDIVAKIRHTTVFTEVKTRRSFVFGPPYLSVTKNKKRKLIQCALCYLKTKGYPDIDWRIDIISVQLNSSGIYIKKIEHFENAIEWEDYKK